MYNPIFDSDIIERLIEVFKFIGIVAGCVGGIALYFYINYKRNQKKDAVEKMHRSWMRRRNELDTWIIMNRHLSLNCLEAQKHIQVELSALEYLSFNKPLNLDEEKRQEWLVSVMDSNKVAELPN